MADLSGKVAVVTGAGRGLGRGIAAGLADGGATVYVTGRTESGAEPPADGSIQAAARWVDALGGRGVPVCVDHRRDDQVERLFRHLLARQGRLDVLVNHLLPGFETARALAVAAMAEQGGGLIVSLALPGRPAVPAPVPDGVTSLVLAPAAPHFTGRCVAALAMDPDLPEKDGGVYAVEVLAREYRFTDPDAVAP